MFKTEKLKKKKKIFENGQSINSKLFFGEKKKKGTQYLKGVNSSAGSLLVK